YGLGLNGSSVRLYRISPTGAATQIGADISVPQSTGATLGTSWGLDFNPVVDRIRVVSTGRDNFRLNPDTGALVVDVALSSGYQITAIAYDRSFFGASASTLFGIDFLADKLVMIGGVDGVPSPNGGVVTEIGSMGVVTAVPATEGFDV